MVQKLACTGVVPESGRQSRESQESLRRLSRSVSLVDFGAHEVTRDEVVRCESARLLRDVVLRVVVGYVARLLGIVGVVELLWRVLHRHCTLVLCLGHELSVGGNIAERLLAEAKSTSLAEEVPHSVGVDFPALKLVAVRDRLAVLSEKVLIWHEDGEVVDLGSFEARLAADENSLMEA